MKAFETIDISGDVGLRIFGNDLAELFKNAANGLYSLITDTSQVEIKKSISITAHGDNLESLLIAFLNELIFYFDTEGFMGQEIKINSINEQEVEATASGEEFDPDRHEGKLLIKAATYHKVMVEKSEGTWTASVIFDI